jgi:hypothetical protein
MRYHDIPHVGKEKNDEAEVKRKKSAGEWNVPPSPAGVSLS